MKADCPPKIERGAESGVVTCCKVPLKARSASLMNSIGIATGINKFPCNLLAKFSLETLTNKSTVMPIVENGYLHSADIGIVL